MPAKSRLNPEAKAHFLAALRSGDYAQCRGIDRERGPFGWDYCAYGVLADVYQRATGQDPWELELSESAVAGNDPGEWLGLTWDQARELFLRNDTGQTFEELATWVEGL